VKHPLPLDSLLVLDAIARKGSFAAAAKALHRVPSAVTYSIQKLESQLNVALFNRQGHRATLTEAGERLLKDGRLLLQLSEQVQRSVEQVGSGWESELRVAIADTVPLTPILEICQEFMAISPHTELRLSEEVLSGTWDALISGRCDLVIGATGEIPSVGGLSVQPYIDMEFIFAVSPNHPFAHAEQPITEPQLMQEIMVVVADSARSLPTRSAAVLQRQKTITVSSMETKRQAQILGIGMGYLPDFLIEEDLKSKRLIQKQTVHDAFKVQTLLAWNSHSKGKGLQWFVTALLEKQHEPLPKK